MKHTYNLETFCYGQWISVIRDGSLGYCRGYLDARKDQYPRNAYRLSRSDGKLMEETEVCEDISVGMVAGYPTATQYETSGHRALKMAASIRARESEVRE